MFLLAFVGTCRMVLLSTRCVTQSVNIEVRLGCADDPMTFKRIPFFHASGFGLDVTISYN